MYSRDVNGSEEVELEWLGRGARTDAVTCQAWFLRVAFSAPAAHFLCLKTLTTSYPHLHRQSRCCRGPLNERRRYDAPHVPAMGAPCAELAC
jgi:hypothetical protein